MTEESLFHEALKRDAAERPEFLAEACGRDLALRRKVEALLAAHAGSNGPLEATGAFTPPADELAATAAFAGAQPRVRIAGRYELLERIGEGGMGEVWVAQQSEPVKRKVALKLIKPGMDSRAVLQRFEAERQALALMDHPNIARVIDGGVDGEPGASATGGRPYFIMELVNGLPLTKFCDEAKLTPRQRLELFIPICQAVQHAHQKGIVHRDLKPSNILVTLIDGKPVPKVIDFGVAKATGGKLTDDTLSTGFGAVVGTLEYMSPEQAGFSGQDIDTRADIYSLGVVLYELLTGLRPIDSKRLRKAALTEMIRIIQEEEPSKPSTRLSTDEALPSLAALRQTEPKKLMALLRGELDWVVMKCLEKQRDRRYETASGLARDIQRYLADEAVEARPASFGYRASKFLKRNKGPALAAGLVALALLGGLAGSLWQMSRAVAAEKAAVAERDAKALALEREATERRKADDERKRADKETENAIAICRFLQEDLLLQASASNQAGMKEGVERNPNLSLREALDRAAAKIGERFKDRPEVEAALRHTLADAYHGIGRDGDALPHGRRAVELFERNFGADHPGVAATKNTLACAYFGQGHIQEAMRLSREVMQSELARRQPEAPAVRAARNNLALSLQNLGRLPEALKALEEEVAIAERLDGRDSRSALVSAHSLVSILHAMSQLPQAKALGQDVVQRAERHLGRDHPLALSAKSQLGVILADMRELERAEKLLKEALADCRGARGPEHPETLAVQGNLASLLADMGKEREAVALMRLTLAAQTKAGSQRARHGTTTKINLGSTLSQLGEHQEAHQFLMEAVTELSAQLGKDSPAALIARTNLAATKRHLGRSREAADDLRQIIGSASKVLGPDHDDTEHAQMALAQCLNDLGQRSEAKALLEDLLRRSHRKRPDRHVAMILRGNLAAILIAMDDVEAAHALCAENVASARRVGHPQLAMALKELGAMERKLKRFDAAERLLREAMALAAKEPGAGVDASVAAEDLLMLGRLQLAQAKAAEAEASFRQALALLEQLKAAPWRQALFQSFLGQSLVGQKKLADAEPLLLGSMADLRKHSESIPEGDRQHILADGCLGLVRLYEALGKADEAAKWKQEVRALQSVATPPASPKLEAKP